MRITKNGHKKTTAEAMVLIFLKFNIPFKNADLGYLSMSKV